MANLRDFNDLRLSGDETDAERIVRSIANRHDMHGLSGDPMPSEKQIGAVLRALADHSLNMRRTSEAMKAHGADEPDASWQHATAIGRYFQFMADELEK